MTACELCDANPAQGDSSISDLEGRPHQLCHPDVGDVAPGAARELSCLEIMGFVLVEHLPYARRPPRPLPLGIWLRAHHLAARITDTTRRPATGPTHGGHDSGMETR